MHRFYRRNCWHRRQCTAQLRAVTAPRRRCDHPWSLPTTTEACRRVRAATDASVTSTCCASRRTSNGTRRASSASTVVSRWMKRALASYETERPIVGETTSGSMLLPHSRSNVLITLIHRTLFMVRKLLPVHFMLLESESLIWRILRLRDLLFIYLFIYLKLLVCICKTTICSSQNTET